MRYGLLTRRHPSVDPALLARYEALYVGGHAFRAALPSFVPRNPLESLELYRLRCSEAYYRSYCGPIIDFFAAQLFASPFVVRTYTSSSERDNEDIPVPSEVDPYYAALKEDCDGRGTDLEQLAKERFVAALVKGSSWIVAELPGDDGAPPQDRGEWDRRGLGAARLRPLDPEDVIDWEVAPDGSLLWGITYSSTYRREDPRQDRARRTDTWRLYDATDVETFEITYDPRRTKLKAETEIPSVGKVPHRFPRVPLVQLRLPEGLWLLNRIADAQIEHFRLSCALSWATKRCCYPMGVFRSEDQDKPPVTGAGYLQVIGVKESFEWVAPSTAPLEALASQIDQQKDEIYRVASVMANSADNNAAAMGRSGESKAADAAATEIVLHAYGNVVKDAIEELFELISDGRGDYAVHFSIEGMDVFNLDAVTTGLANVKAALDMGFADASPTLARELRTKAADLLLPDAEQSVKDAIRQELASPPAAPRKALPAAPATPPENSASASLG